jgi:hypothetical protein
MKKFALLLTLFLFLAFAQVTKAQSYTTGIGLRLTNWYGLTIKHHLSEANAIEGILHTRWGGLLITGLYEHHFPAFGQDGLRWYVGIGGHVGFWSDYNNKNLWFEDDQDARAAIGLDLIGGIEYTIPDVPINLSLDFKPGFNLVPASFFIYDDIALSVRYVF